MLYCNLEEYIIQKAHKKEKVNKGYPTTTFFFFKFQNLDKRSLYEDNTDNHTWKFDMFRSTHLINLQYYILFGLISNSKLYTLYVNNKILRRCITGNINYTLNGYYYL